MTVTGALGADNVVAENATDACQGGDVVTTSCPFADHNLDSQLAGHTIVQLRFSHFGMCADSNSDFEMNGNGCSGAHAAYIRVDNGLELLSVGASNQRFGEGLADVILVTGQGSGPAVLQDPNVSGWQYEWELESA